MLGLRVSDPSDLVPVANLVERLGCEPRQDGEHVQIIWSFWRAREARRKNTRNFHLVYDDGNVIIRTTDENELWEELEQRLLERIEVSSGRTPLVILGKVVRSPEGDAILVATEDQELADKVPLETIVPHGRVLVTKDGQFRNLPRGLVSKVCFPGLPGDNLSDAMKYAYLRGACISEGNYASPLLREFVSRVGTYRF